MGSLTGYTHLPVGSRRDYRSRCSLSVRAAGGVLKAGNAVSPLLVSPEPPRPPAGWVGRPVDLQLRGHSPLVTSSTPRGIYMDLHLGWNTGHLVTTGRGHHHLLGQQPHLPHHRSDCQLDPHRHGHPDHRHDRSGGRSEDDRSCPLGVHHLVLDELHRECQRDPPGQLDRGHHVQATESSGSSTTPLVLHLGSV